MPKFNADEQGYDPIEIILEGQTYYIEKISQSMLDDISLIGKKAKESLDKGEEDIGILRRQLGILLSVDSKIFEDVDVRKASATIRYLTATITEQIEGKSKNDSRES